MSGGDFWSRRKAEVAREQEAERADEAAEVARSEQAALEEKSDQEILVELDLPDPDSLQQGDDIRAFMARAVPDRIRRRALRQLWRLNPVLANVDGLVDYGEDFTDAGTVVETLQTAYQVGKGMLAHVEELARQEAGENADTTAADAVSEPPEEADAAHAEPAAAAVADKTYQEQADEVSENVAISADPGESEASAEPPRPRRMRFDFGG